MEGIGLADAAVIQHQLAPQDIHELVAVVHLGAAGIRVGLEMHDRYLHVEGGAAGQKLLIYGLRILRRFRQGKAPVAGHQHHVVRLVWRKQNVHGGVQRLGDGIERGYGDVGFSMRVLAYDPFCPPEAFAAYGAENCTLEEVLAQGDIISVHLPVLPSTVGMIDSSWFAQMKQGALLINTARAKVIDQQAMVQALTQGKLAGAAVDVMWQEPCPANHPFLSMDNVIVSPHMAGATVDIDMWQSRLACEDLEAYLNGQPCPHVFKG